MTSFHLFSLYGQLSAPQGGPEIRKHHTKPSPWGTGAFCAVTEEVMNVSESQLQSAYSDTKAATAILMRRHTWLEQSSMNADTRAVLMNPQQRQGSL